MSENTPASAKLLDADLCQLKMDSLRAENKKIVLCHGVFDLMHPGHITHLQEAKEHGDVLVVSVTAAKFVNRGPGRPIFGDDLRIFALQALQCVDYVMLSHTTNALDVIDLVKPDFYAKGLEYADNDKDVTGEIKKEIERVQKYGGNVCYAGSVVFSSTELMNEHLQVLPPLVKEYAGKIAEEHSLDDIHRAVEAMRGLKVLVLGDAIIDEYVHSRIQGVAGKSSVLSVRFLDQEQHLGGSLAVAQHIASFCDSVTVAGVIGDEPEIHRLLLNKTSGRMRLELLHDPHYSTIRKLRYVTKQGNRDAYTKLFAVNYLKENCLREGQRSILFERLKRSIENYDMVVLTDFGHGLVDQTLMDLVQQKARFLALNCQTNSANHGYNLITKYCRADTFCLDEQELCLAYATRTGNHRELLAKLQSQLKAEQCWLTLGSSGSLGRNAAEREHATPALTLHVTDTTGAGDAFFALASLSARLSLPLPIGSLLGNLAGGLTANVLGNADAVSKSKLLKYATTVLKQSGRSAKTVTLGLYPTADDPLGSEAKNAASRKAG